MCACTCGAYSLLKAGEFLFTSSAVRASSQRKTHKDTQSHTHRYTCVEPVHCFLTCVCMDLYGSLLRLNIWITFSYYVTLSSDTVHSVILFPSSLITPRHRLPYSVPLSPFLTSLFVILKSCSRHPPVFLPACHSATLRVDFHKTCPQQRPDNVLLSTHASRSSKAGRRLVGFLGHPLFSQALKNNWLKQTGSRWTIGWIYLTFMHECT